MAYLSFKDRVAVITGAGNGLGKDYALALARRGVKVVVNDLGTTGSGMGTQSATAALVVEQIRDEGGEAIANYDSVADRAGGAAIIQTALDAYGKVDICICNAGFLREAAFEDVDDEQFDALLAVHLKGAFHVAQPAYRSMMQHGYGRFLFTGSASAMYGQPWQTSYATAKGSVVGLSNIIATEGSAYAIHSNVILPVAVTRLAEETHHDFHRIPRFADMMKCADMSASQDRVTVPFNTPLAIYLVSDDCIATRGIYSSNSGRYAKVRISTADGWVAPVGSPPPSAEDIAAHFDRICDDTIRHELSSVYEEFTAIAQAARRQDAL